MDIQRLEETIRQLFRQPLKTSLLLLVLVLVGIIVLSGKFFIEEQLRRRAFSPEMPDKKYTVAPNDPQSTENRYVRITKVSPLGKGSHALIVEFGVRNQATEGVHAGIDVTSKYTDVREWFAPPERTDVPASTGGVFLENSRRQEPPIYARKFSSPSVTPDKSYYWYFEAVSPLKVKEVLFRGFYE